MNPDFNPSTVERLAQAAWNACDAYRVTEGALDSRGEPKPKFYACSMLPYPSGKLTTPSPHAERGGKNVGSKQFDYLMRSRHAARHA